MTTTTTEATRVVCHPSSMTSKATTTCTAAAMERVTERCLGLWRSACVTLCTLLTGLDTLFQIGESQRLHLVCQRGPLSFQLVNLCFTLSCCGGYSRRCLCLFHLGLFQCLFGLQSA